MKIIYIYSSFTIASGADWVVIEKANHLAGKGYNVTIVTDSQQERVPFFQLSNNVKLYDLGINFEKDYKYGSLIRIFLYYNLMRKYKKTLSSFLYQEKPDIVITTIGRSMLFLTSINDGSIKIGESHIAKQYIQSFFLLNNKSPLHKLIAKIWMKKITKNCEKLNSLVLLTKEDAKNWSSVTRTHVIPNPLPFTPTTLSTCGNRQAIFVARMCDQKEYDYLIKAWELVHGKHPDWILNIFGDGEERETILAQIHKKGLDDTILINGTTKNIQDKYLESSICILGSRFEGFGLVLHEAMVCGVPCVAYDCPYDPSNIIKNGEDGFIVKYLDYKALAKQVCILIENESLRKQMGTNARKNIQRFDKDKIMKEWETLLLSLTEKRDNRIMYIFSELTIKGGADKVISDKANYLSSHGYDVTIVTETQMGRPTVFPLSPKVKLIDMGIDFNKQYTQCLFQRVYTYYSCIYRYKKKLKSIILKEKPDIIITTMSRSLDFITDIKDNSIKIGESHTTKSHLRSLHLMEEKGGLYKWIAKYIRKKQTKKAQELSVLVLLTPEDAKDWEGTTKTFVIPNAMPYFPANSSNLMNKQAIMVGRYNDAKGYEYIIEAWDIVHKKHPEWILNIYGSGEMHDDVKKWIHDRHLEETMIMHEPTNQIMQKYLESSICVMSSRYEGFPLVIMEAMSCGVPCVSFDTPFGPRNIIKDGEDGILVEYLNSQALAENICKVIEDDHLRKRLGEKAKQNIQRFSQDTIMKQWTDLFDSLLSTKKQ